MNCFRKRVQVLITFFRSVNSKTLKQREIILKCAGNSVVFIFSLSTVIYYLIRIENNIHNIIPILIIIIPLLLLPLSSSYASLSGSIRSTRHIPIHQWITRASFPSTPTTDYTECQAATPHSSPLTIRWRATPPGRSILPTTFWGSVLTLHTCGKNSSACWMVMCVC